MLLLFASLALAAPEESAEADALATARTALAQAGAALEDARKLAGRTGKLETAVGDHERRLKVIEEKLKGGGLTSAELEKLIAELGAIKAAAEKDAAAAKTARFAAEEEARKAKAARVAIEEEEIPSLTAGVDRDAADEDGSTLYGAVGAGASWMFRGPSYGESGGVMVLETEELSSGIVDFVLEGGREGVGDKGRVNLGLRGTAGFNPGGGSHLTAALTLGTFVEKSHVVRLEAHAGVSHETIASMTEEDYRDFRALVGVGVEAFFVPEVWSVVFSGEFLPDNDTVDGSNAGRVAGAVRYHF